MIRLATHGDAASLAALSTELGYPTTPAQMQERLSHVLASDLGAVFVFETADGRVIGAVHIIERHLIESDPFCEIMGLIVSEKDRGHGAGGALVAAAEAWTADRGIPNVRVRSNVIRERAHGFYLARGYVEVKRQAVFNKPLGSPGGEGPVHVA